MADLTVKCPKCDHPFKTASLYEPARCTRCGNVFTAKEKNEERSEAEEMFLSGSSYLVLGKHQQAAELFLAAAKLSPGEAKNWLYLLCAMTKHFKLLYPIAEDRASFLLKRRKIIYRSVYKNFISAAKDEDYLFERSQFGIDLSPESGELWHRILKEMLDIPTSKLNIAESVKICHFATKKLLKTNPQLAKTCYPALCKHLNPVNEGVLEINTLMYYPDSEDEVLRLDTKADSVEFYSDKLEGAERYRAFLLTKNIQNIGAFFPFKELIVDKGVTEIPDHLMCFCAGIETVKLSNTVKKIGAYAFSDCVNLSTVAPLDSVQEIGDRAFMGTSVRTLKIPTIAYSLGREVLGAKNDAAIQIHKYVIELDAELAQRSKDFNKVGDQKCGYVTRKLGKYSMHYPQKRENGTNKPLTRDEKRIFEALACVIMDADGEHSPFGFTQKIQNLAAGIVGKFKK